MTTNALSTLLREGLSPQEHSYLDDRVVLDDMARWRNYDYHIKQELGSFAERVGFYWISIFRIGIIVPGSGKKPDALGDFRSFSKLSIEFPVETRVWYNKPQVLAGNPDMVYSKTDVEFLKPGDNLQVNIEGLTEDRRIEKGDSVDYRVILPIDICAIRKVEKGADEEKGVFGTMIMKFSVTVAFADDQSSEHDLLPILEFTQLPASQFLSSSSQNKFRLHEIMYGNNAGYVVTPNYVSVANEGTHNYLHWHFVRVNGRSAIGLMICDSDGNNGVPVALKALQDEDVRILGPGVSRVMTTTENAIGKVFNEYRFHRGSGNWLLTDGDDVWYASGEEPISKVPQFDKTVPLMYFNIAQKLRNVPSVTRKIVFNGKKSRWETKNNETY